ncbi:MAG: hypothetical protein V7644_149 [Actinomycetota bacterium]
MGVTALLAVAGIASHGRPLSGASRRAGPTAAFFDYVWTTAVLFGVAMTAVLAYALLSGLPERPNARVRRFYLLSAILSMFAAAAVAILLLHTGFVDRLTRAAKQEAKAGQRGAPRPTAARPAGRDVRNPRARWDEIGIVLALLGGTVVVLLARRGARRAAMPLRRTAQQAVSLALDESLDDLRGEPDVRRAIIAAYARMERALAAGGIPRAPAEAPFEFLERALRSLDTSAAAVHRLTDLFEWAKFSQHEPEPAMRDDAIEALVAVRDELRRPVEAAVA